MNPPKFNRLVTAVLISITLHAVEAFAPSRSIHCSIPATSSAIFKYPYDDNDEPRSVGDLTIEELKDIAFSKGYATAGMDRRSLEMIASESFWQRGDSGFSSNNMPPPSTPNSRWDNQGNIINADFDTGSNNPNSRNGNMNSQPQYEPELPNFQLEPSEQFTPPYQPQVRPQNEFIITRFFKSPELRAAFVGFFTGVVAASPVTYVHTCFLSEVLDNEFSQFLFDTVTGGISAAAFATIYRYFIQPFPSRNDNLKMGIIGAFVLCRSFSRIQPSMYCNGLICGAPLGFMDWGMLQQCAWNFAEDLSIFGAAALVLENACDKGFVSYVQDSRRNME